MQKSSITDGIREITLDSWREFAELALQEFSKAPALIYRGQRDYTWPLRSRLSRLATEHPRRRNLETGTDFQCPPFTEAEHLSAFRRAIRGRRGPQARPLSDNELWLLGQHHGLCTPFLDWTRSPFIALFFAFEVESEVEFRGVYALSTVDSVFGLEEKALKLVSPDSSDNFRLISQAALSTRLPANTDVERCIARQFQGTTNIAFLTKIKIPAGDRNACLVALNQMNVNHMTLFPDLNGAAMHVNSMWEPGHEDSLAYL